MIEEKRFRVLAGAPLVAAPQIAIGEAVKEQNIAANREGQAKNDYRKWEAPNGNRVPATSGRSLREVLGG